MPSIALFGTSIAFSFVVWSLVTANFIWPELRDRSRVDALSPLLMLHAFRFIGLSFLIPGVVSPDLPAAFAFFVAYGDIAAAVLALLSLAALRGSLGIPLVWIFNVWVPSICSTRFIRPTRAASCRANSAPPIFSPR